jgi:hypothetical protein
MTAISPLQMRARPHPAHQNNNTSHQTHDCLVSQECILSRVQDKEAMQTTRLLHICFQTTLRSRTFPPVRTKYCLVPCLDLQLQGYIGRRIELGGEDNFSGGGVVLLSTRGRSFKPQLCRFRGAYWETITFPGRERGVEDGK